MKRLYTMSKFPGLFISITVSLLIVLTAGCKKDEEAESSESMIGILNFVLPEYMLSGTQYNLIGEGITFPVTGINYKWSTTGFAPDSATGLSATVITPLEIGEYTVTLSAQMDGYYSKSISRTTTIIKPSSPESFSGVVYGNDFITDPRDGKHYYFSEIGDLFWFSSNLNWEGSGRPYKNISALSHIYGRLYSWQEATATTGDNGICPPGWRVPTNQDWENLAKYLNGGVSLPFDDPWRGLGSKITVEAKLNGANMWKYSPNNNKENLFHWNALPGGNATGILSSFININYYGIWWSSTQADASNAHYRYIYFDSSDFSYNIANKTYFGASVRCVREVNQ